MKTSSNPNNSGKKRKNILDYFSKSKKKKLPSLASPSRSSTLASSSPVSPSSPSPSSSSSSCAARASGRSSSREKLFEGKDNGLSSPPLSVSLAMGHSPSQTPSQTLLPSSASDDRLGSVVEGKDKRVGTPATAATPGTPGTPGTVVSSDNNGDSSLENSRDERVASAATVRANATNENGEASAKLDASKGETADMHGDKQRGKQPKRKRGDEKSEPRRERAGNGADQYLGTPIISKDSSLGSLDGTLIDSPRDSPHGSTNNAKLEKSRVPQKTLDNDDGPPNKIQSDAKSRKSNTDSRTAAKPKFRRRKKVSSKSNPKIATHTFDDYSDFTENDNRNTATNKGKVNLKIPTTPKSQGVAKRGSPVTPPSPSPQSPPFSTASAMNDPKVVEAQSTMEMSGQLEKKREEQDVETPPSPVPSSEMSSPESPPTPAECESDALTPKCVESIGKEIGHNGSTLGSSSDVGKPDPQNIGVKQVLTKANPASSVELQRQQHDKFDRKKSSLAGTPSSTSIAPSPQKQVGTPGTPPTPPSPPTSSKPSVSTASQLQTSSAANANPQTRKASSPNKSQLTSFFSKTTKSKSPTQQKQKSKSQFYLDFGQASFGKQSICSICGMLRVHGLEEDDAQHARICKEYKEGVAFLGWKSERRVAIFGSGDEDKIVEVRPGDPPQYRKKVLEVKSIVDAELGFATHSNAESINSKKMKYFDLSSLSLQALQDITCYLYISKKRVVGLLLVKLLNHAYQLNDDAYSQNDSHSRSLTKSKAMMGVHQIWCHRSHRQSGIASKLCNAARASLVFGMTVPLELVAFSSPTADGIKFAKKYLGTKRPLVYDINGGK